MRIKHNKLIGQILLEKGVINQQQLEVALQEQKKTNELICSTLIRLGFCTEEKVFAILSEQLNIPYIKLKNIEVDPTVIQKIPAKFANHYKIFPFELKNNMLFVAMADPLNVRILDDLKLLLNMDFQVFLASESEIKKAIRKYYGIGAETIESILSDESQILPNLELEKIQDLEEMAQEASIIKFVNQLLAEAIKERATDVHLEPFEDRLRARFRIDGILYEITVPETIKYLYPSVISRLKIMSQLNIAEKRLPQDGRIKVKINQQELDLRISVMPTAFGESIHIRILSPSFFLELEKLGLLPEDLNVLENVIKKPHGIIFVTGPTGSGKSTTLYACLSKLNTVGVKIITIEDPIEYQLYGISQIQVNPKIGLTFATGLRHILRHDPDIIMVGEVRDFETAEIAIRAALTGHLVFSTLHTNNAAGAVTRLLDMGIEPFLVASSIECVIAQRLVRLICPKCKTQVPLSKEILEEFSKITDKTSFEIYEGKGCSNCRFTGYYGRTGIYEVLTINDEIRNLILNRAPAHQIQQKAITYGMKTLREDGLKKVLLGLTTVSEVFRVTPHQEEVF